MTSVEVTSEQIPVVDPTEHGFNPSSDGEDEDEIFGAKKPKGNRKALIDSDVDDANNENPPSSVLNVDVLSSKSLIKSDDDIDRPHESPSKNDLATSDNPPPCSAHKPNVSGNGSDSVSDQELREKKNKAERREGANATNQTSPDADRMTSVEVTSEQISVVDPTEHGFDPSSDGEDEDEIFSAKKPKGNRKALIDSDDDDENHENADANDGLSSRSSIKSADDDTDRPHEPPSKNNLATNDNPPPSSMDKPNDSGNSSDSDSDPQVVRRKDKGPDDSDRGSGSDSETCEFSIDQIKSQYYESKSTKIQKKNKAEREEDADTLEQSKKSSKSSEPRTNRKAKLAAIEEIHSVTQRLVRESNASLPYHNPKPRSLDDFLNRRKTQPKVPLKTGVDKLSEVWKFTEDQVRTAEIVYKSDDEDSEPKDASDQPDNEPQPTNDASEKTNSVDDKSEESKVEETAADSETLNFHLSELTEGCFVQNSVTHIEPLTAEEESALESAAEVNVPSEPEIEPAVKTDMPEQPAKKDSAMTVVNKERFHNSVISVKSVPKLSGGANGMIELDDFSKSGTLGFIKRYMKHSTLKSKDIGADRAGSEDLVGSEMSEENSGDKPSKKLLALKANLHKKIVANREQQLAKRVEEYKIAEEEFFGVEEEAEYDISKFDEFELDDKEKGLNEQISEKSDAEDSEDDLLGNDDNDEEDEEEENENDMSFLDNKAEEVSDCEEKVNGSSEPEGEEEALEDLLSSEPVPEKLELNLDEEISPVKQSQLLDLCSGKFSSQPLRLLESEDEAEDTKIEYSSQSQPGIIGQSPVNDRSQPVLEDSDDDDVVGPRPKKKKVRKLSFSDDEDEGDVKNELEANISTNELEKEDDEVLEEDEEILEEEDEDENKNEEDNVLDDEEVEDEEEILAEQLGRDFLEGEAELSESEWGSDDEDERNLDEFEAEDGDREKFSQRKLRRELEQIHARELMAEDKRKIRLMQELYLEDGELHSDGPKRQRLYRWYNEDENDANGVSIPAENHENDLGDDEDEETWRKGRIERENFLRQQKIDVMESQDNEILSTTVRTVIVKSTAQLNDTTNTAPPIPKSPNVKTRFSLLTNRGSFLSRGEKILSRIAELTTGAGTGDARKAKGGNNRNMVFAVVSPEKGDKVLESSKPTKRKGDTPQGLVKKIKHSTVPKPSFLDRLRDEDT